MHPADWWLAMNNSSLKEKNLDTIITLMKLPASTGSLERAFSVLNNIMTDKRNRLGIQKASKLCCIYQTLNNLKDDNGIRRGKKRALQLDN
jgi:hAT family protein